MNNLAEGYEAAGKLDKALPLYEETLAAMKAKLGPDHPYTLTIMANLAAAYWSAKRLDRSIPLFEELFPLQEKRLGRDHPETLKMAANLGVNYRDAGRLKDAIPLLEEAYRASKKYSQLRWVGTALLNAFLLAGKVAEARMLIDELLADDRKQLAKDSPQLAQQLASYSRRLLDSQGFVEAEPLLRECLAIRAEDSARCLVHLQHSVDARPRSAGPEKVYRRGTATFGRLRGDETTGTDDSTAGQHPPPRGPRPADRVLHRDEQAGPGDEVAGRAGQVP